MIRPPSIVSALVAGVALLGPSRPDAAAQVAPPATSFAGAYELGGLRGEAAYAYVLAGGDTVLTGPFRFRASDAAALLGDGDRYADIAGQFRDDRPVGPWRFDLGELRAAAGAEVRDLRYHVAVDGRRRRVEGGFREGRPEGTWTTTTEAVVRSRPTDTLFRGELTFVGGRPQRSFRLRGEDAELLGLVSRRGLAEDTWTLLGPDGRQEDWRFADGRLLAVTLTRDGDATEVPVLGSLPADTAHVELDGDYLRFLEVYLRLRGDADGGAVSGSRTARLLRANIAAYEEVAAALASVAEVDLAPHIQVVVPAVPLDARAAAQLQRIAAAVADFDAAAEALLSDATVRIVATTDDEVARLRAAAQALRDDLLAPARQLSADYRAGVLARVPTADYLAAAWPDGRAEAEVAFGYVGPSGRQRGSYLGPGDTRFEVRDGGLAAVLALVRYANASLADLRRELGTRVTTAEAGVSPAGAPDAGSERQLQAAAARLDSLVATVPRRRARDLRLDAVAGHSRREVSAYGKLDALSRQRRLPSLAACTEDLYALAVQLKSLPVRMAQVREAYTDEVWNNIIATVMEERVKKRLTRAYEDLLVPYYLDRVRDELTCESAGAIATGLDGLHARLLRLRDEDTADLEERLRDVDDPRAALSLLHAKPLN